MSLSKYTVDELADMAVGDAFFDDARYTYLPRITQLPRGDGDLYNKGFEAARKVYFSRGTWDVARAAALEAIVKAAS